MNTKNTYDVIKYFQLDERVNFENFRRTAVKIEFDRDVFYDWIDFEGNEQIEDGFRHYDEISECHFQDPTKEEYYSNTWAEKKFYNAVRELVHESKVNICVDTLSMIAICIRHDKLRIETIGERLKNTDEEFEFMKVHKALWEIVHESEPATSITINSCNRILVKTQFVKNSAERIIQSLGKFNWLEYNWKAQQYIQYDWKPYEIKKFYETFIRYTVRQLNQFLLAYIPSQPSRYFFIDQILAIASCGKHSIVKRNNPNYTKERDNINRKMKELFK
jgi:hypothetical protein